MMLFMRSPSHVLLCRISTWAARLGHEQSAAAIKSCAALSTRTRDKTHVREAWGFSARRALLSGAYIISLVWLGTLCLVPAILLSEAPAVVLDRVGHRALARF